MSVISLSLKSSVSSKTSVIFVLSVAVVVCITSLSCTIFSCLLSKLIPNTIAKTAAQAHPPHKRATFLIFFFPEDLSLLSSPLSEVFSSFFLSFAKFENSINGSNSYSSSAVFFCLYLQLQNVHSTISSSPTFNVIPQFLQTNSSFFIIIPLFVLLFY